MTAVHMADCGDVECAVTYGVHPGDAWFICVRCDRRCGYCKGGADDMPAVCDECYLEIVEAQ